MERIYFKKIMDDGALLIIGNWNHLHAPDLEEMNLNYLKKKNVLNVYYLNHYV